MKRVWNFLFSWRCLAVMVLVLLAVMVWFVGPWLDLGGLRPFEGILVRLALIGLLLLATLFWLLAWPMWIVSVLALCALIWFGGPMVALQDYRPLGSVQVRLLTIVLIAVLAGLYGLFALLRLLRTDEALLRRILRPQQQHEVDPQASSEVRAVRLVVARAVGQLRRLRGVPQGWRSLLESKRYLYELPWYLIIGTPGVGKTTAVLNSGLEFPLAEQMGMASVPGAGGTLNCDWWFTNEAVMIDTAGRYSDQNEQGSEEAAAANAAEWRGFLGALSKHRTRAPINGVILTVSVAELLERRGAALAAILRARLVELREALGIRFPVYVLVTKLDLLPGFDEYFQSLTAEGRAQVWGFTLDRAEDEALDLHARIAQELTLLQQRLEEGLNARLVEEYSLSRRKQLYPFPQEFRSLSEELAKLLSMVFLDSRYDDVQIKRMLRGVYLSSARQAEQVVPADNGALFQRLRRTLQRAYGKDDFDLTAALREPGLAANRSYFLRNLFKQVIIPEAHLVQPNQKWIMRQGVLRWGGHALSAGLAIWLVGGMVTSRANNDQYLETVDERAKVLTVQAEMQRDTALDARGIRLLTEAATLANVEGLDLDAPPLNYRYGLYSADSVDTAVQQTYGRLLREHLLPAVQRTLIQSLQRDLANQDTDALYETLGLYLSLFDTRYDESAALVDWIERDWAQTRRDNPLERSQLAVHLRSLFGSQYTALPLAQQDRRLVEAVRDLLQARPDANRLYERALRSMEAMAPPRFSLQRALGPEDAAWFSDQSPEGASGVPGLYTYEGYTQVFRRRVGDYINMVWARDNWLLGRDDAIDDPARRVRLAGQAWLDKDGVEREIYILYLRDYATYWDRYLRQIRLLGASTADEAPVAIDTATVRALASADSPLIRLGFLLVRQTTLSGETEAEQQSAAISDAAMTAVQRQNGNLARASNALGQIAVRLDPGKLAIDMVDGRYAALREIVTGSALPGPIHPTQPGPQMQQMLQWIGEQYAQLSAASNALAMSAVPVVPEPGMAAFEPETLPVPFKQLLASLSRRTASQVGREMGVLLARQVDDAVGKACRAAIAGRFPFADAQQEVDPDDFVQLFAAGGLFDTAFQRILASYVDTGARPWRYRPVGAGMASVRGPDLSPFERAADIRAAMFDTPGNRALGYHISGRITAVDPAITELVLDVDGDGLRYMHGPVEPFSLSWPGPRGGSYLELTARPRVTGDSSTIYLTGPWAPFRLMQQGRVTATASSGRALVDFDFDGRHAVVEVGAGRRGNFLTGNLLQGFRCPGGAP